MPTSTRLRRLSPRFARFGLVGATGTVLNLSLFWCLTASLPVQPLIAATLSFELALCSNFLLNHNWTFRDRRSGQSSLLTGMARYQIVSIGGLLINLLVLHTLSTELGVVPLLANAIGIGLATFWNFWLSLLWTWRQHEPPHARAMAT
jgi:dolichol-phosphate mannosyltransferase